MNTLQNLKFQMLKQPGALIDNAAVGATAFDALDAGQVLIQVILGATDIAITVMKLQESDNNSDWTDVPNGDFTGAFPSASDDNKLYGWFVKMDGARKRYLKPLITVGDGSVGGYVAVQAIAGHLSFSPTTDAEQGFASILKV